MEAIFTIGHSTRTIEEFIGLLKMHSVRQLVDIRTIPKSRHNPQFAKDNLTESLHAAGIAYTHLEALGGLRPTAKNSVNGAWRNKSFRGYADYMQTEDFAHGIDELIELADNKPAAIMCAEAVPWRCHRSLVADALTVRGFEVRDIINENDAKVHTLTSFAVVRGTKITYPA